MKEKEVDFEEAMEICSAIFYDEIHSKGFNHSKMITIKNTVKKVLEIHGIEAFRMTQDFLLKNHKEKYGRYDFHPNRLLSWFSESQEMKEKDSKQSLTLSSFLPELFDQEKRIIPNAFLRSALFGIVRPGKRSIVENMKIPSMSQYEILYTGNRLDQNDLKVWDAVTYLAKEKNVDEGFRISMYELCKFMGYSFSKTNRDNIKMRLKRLKVATVEIKFNKKFYVGSLIDDFSGDEIDGKVSIGFNKKLMRIFETNDYTIINQKKVDALGENQLAKWIFHFYETHERPLPFKIEFLRDLCGSENNLRDFKYRLKEALFAIKEIYKENKAFFDYEIEDDEVLIFKSEKKPQLDQTVFD